MSTSYTSRAKLAVPDTADELWDVALNVNWTDLDNSSGVGDLVVTPTEIPSANLTAAVAAGAYQSTSGGRVTYAGLSSYSLPANSTTKLWIVDGGAIASGSSYPSSGSYVPLATIVTGAGTITSIDDDRVAVSAVGAVTGTFTVSGAGGSVLVANAASGTLGLFGKTPATQAAAITTLTNSTTGTVSNTVGNVGSSFNQANINNALASLTSKVNEILAALQRYGLTP